MSHLPLPFKGTETIDMFRAENLTLKIENNKLEQENVELRHNLQLALTKASAFGGIKQRVTLSKPQSVVAERTWAADVQSVTQAASFSSNAVVESLEQQLADLQSQVAHISREKQDLQNALEAQVRATDAKATELQKLSLQRTDKGTAAAYFQSQISFLHSEVERLEEAARVAQNEYLSKTRMAAEEHSKHLSAKEQELIATRDELQRVRAVAGINTKRGKLDGEDLLSRCRMMEVQLAASLAEKNALHIENGDLHAKVRKLEAAARERKMLLQEVQRSAANETYTNSEHAQRLSLLLAAANDEKQKISSDLEAALAKLNTVRVPSMTQTEAASVSEILVQCDPPPVTLEFGCQVDTIAHFADAGTQSAQSLRHALQTKCSEADELRSHLDHLSAVHKETLHFLEITKSRLGEELNRRRELENDIEGLSLQLRSLQQQVSQQCALDREKDSVVVHAQETQREAQTKLIKVQEEHQQLEFEVTRYKKDLQLLVANQNVHNQQVHELNRQNAVLHEEIQKLRIALENDKYIIQAKDAELRDVVSSYQMLVKESEVLGSSREVMERENEGLRQVIRSLEERNVMCQEQIGHLHGREQQLSLDLQSFDHELGQLHRRLQQSQTREAELDATCQSHLQSYRALECGNDELRRNLAELSKQIVIRDNECMLLRTRCDTLEKDLASISAAQRNDSRRVRDLEEANAQLMVKNILSSQQQHQHQSSSASNTSAAASAEMTNMQREKDILQTTLSRTNASLSMCNDALHNEQHKSEALSKRIASLEDQVQQLSETKEHLERIARDQAAALSQLSK